MDFKQFYKTINFDIDNEIRTVFQATQGDTKSRGLLVDLIVGGVKTPVTTENMTFYALKPDGTRVMTVGVKEGTGFRIDFTNQTFAVPGVLLCTLVLSGTNGEKIADKKFKMTVDSSLEDGAIISEDERGILDRAFDLAEDIVPRLEGLDVPLLENVDSEITLARGTEQTLGARLDGNDAQLADIANGTGLDCGAIRPEKTNFLKVGKNKFNYKTATAGYYVSKTNGDLAPDEQFAATDFIPVTPNTSYKQSVNGRAMAFYDVDYNFISALSNETTSPFTTPPNTAYVRISIRIPYEPGSSHITIDKYMVVLDSDTLDYEPYYLEFVEKKVSEVSSIDIEPNAITKEHLAAGSVTPYALDGVESEGNLLYTTNLIHGKYAYSLNDVFRTLDSPNYVYYIVKVKPNTKYSFTVGRFVLELLEDQTTVTQYLENINSVTTTSEAAYIAVSFNKTRFPIEAYMIVEGEMPEVYTDKVLYRIPWLYIGEHEATDSETLTINLPNELYATVGEEFNVFTKNVLKYDDDDYNVNYSCTIGKQMRGKFTATPTTTGTFPLTLEIYEKSTMIARKTVSIVVSNPRTEPIKVMVLGDSTVRPGHVTQRLVDKMSDNIQLVGVMGNYPNHFEGRGGWTAASYRTDTEYLDFTPGNPFYNPETEDFDFSYYMTTQGITGLQVVIINLGINDTFAFTTDSSLGTGMTNIINNLDFITTSIKAYDPYIKVSFNITIPPNDNQDSFGDSYANGQTQWRYKYNNHIWVAKMIEYYQGKNDLINIHSSIDVVNNISDGVHPSIVGYNQIGDTVYSYLNSLT